jgi:hypothetical protein
MMRLLSSAARILHHTGGCRPCVDFGEMTGGGGLLENSNKINIARQTGDWQKEGAFF